MGLWLDGYSGLTEKIKRTMHDICKSYLYIGFLLDEAKKMEYYKENGHANIYEYASKELNFKKSAVINFIAVYNEFSENGTMHLKDRYEKFNYSQLCEMLSLAPPVRDKVTSDMKVREIRALKKSEISDQTSGLVYLPNVKSEAPIYLPPVKLSGRVYNKLCEYSSGSGLSYDLIIENALDNFLINLFDSMSV